MAVRIRTDDDLDACENLAQVVHGVDGYPPRFPANLRRFTVSSDDTGAWVAEDEVEGRIVGHVALHRTSSAEVMALATEATGRSVENLAVVARLLVAPPARRRGAARTLLSAATAEALARGLWPILDVAVHFGPAIRLYENAGWTRAGTVTVRFRGADPLEELVYIGPAPGET